MQCPHCKSHLENDAVYCTACGKKVSAVSASTPTVFEIIIGREEGCDLVLNSSSVSRRHARVTSDLHVLRVEDLDSKNGITVNGRKVHSQVLNAGDVIGIAGEATLSTDALLTLLQRKYGQSFTAGTAKATPQQTRPHTERIAPHTQGEAVAEDISVRQWMSHLALAMVPLIGIIMLLVWTKDKSVPSRAAWAKLVLVMEVVFICVLGLFLMRQLSFLL